MKHRADIKALVDKFLDGRTTLAEERELYDYFASDDLPREWHDLKAMFAWYGDGMPEDRLPKPAPQPRRSHRAKCLTEKSILQNMPRIIICHLEVPQR